MSWNRVLSDYPKAESYLLKNELKQKIYQDLSKAEVSEKELNDALTEESGGRYNKGLLSPKEKDRKKIYSDAIRNSMADKAAEILSTKEFALEGYEGLKTLLDYSCEKQAEARNQRISDILTGGSIREKSELFNELTNPILRVSPAVFGRKSDEKLVLEWKRLDTQLYRCTRLSKMVKEAKKLGVRMSPERERAFRLLEQKSGMPYKLMSGRAEMMASPYYSVVNVDSLLKVRPEVLKSVRTTDQKMKDFLENICELSENHKNHIKEQVKDRLEHMGYSSIRQVRFGDKSGNDYENREIMGILLKGDPVYILSEEGSLKGVLQVVDRDGFINPTPEEYRLLRQGEMPVKEEKNLSSARSASKKEERSVSLGAM